MGKSTEQTRGGQWRKSSKAVAAAQDVGAAGGPGGRFRVRVLVLVGLAAWPFVYLYRRLKRGGGVVAKPGDKAA
jgi:hypothetical protein